MSVIQNCETGSVQHQTLQKLDPRSGISSEYKSQKQATKLFVKLNMKCLHELNALFVQTFFNELQNNSGFELVGFECKPFFEIRGSILLLQYGISKCPKCWIQANRCEAQLLVQQLF